MPGKSNVIFELDATLPPVPFGEVSKESNECSKVPPEKEKGL